MADIHPTTIDRAIRSARDLDIAVEEIHFYLPKRGGTDLQKGARKRLGAAIANVRELRNYLDDLQKTNEETDQ